MDEPGANETGQWIQTPITEVKAIERSRNSMITTREEIREYVETPIVDACEHFWDLNVRTLSSSANEKDVDRKAYIILDYDSLSDANKKIAEESGEKIDNYDGRPAVDILIPVTKDTTAEDIRVKATEIANRFKKQKATWIPSYSLQEMRQIYAIDPNDDEYGVEGFVEEGYFYDIEGKRFYLSEEHYNKTKEKIIDTV